MNLVIDIGNTRTKVFVFDGKRLVNKNALSSLGEPGLKKIFSSYSIEAAIVSSVVKTAPPFFSFLKKNTAFVSLSKSTPLPIRNRYRSKETLGNDRIANAVGASVLFPSQNCLVIDLGTCVKYDFVNSRKEYLGGAISPGLEMRY